MLVQKQVGPLATTASITPGVQVNGRAGNMGEDIVSELHGRYYEGTYRRALETGAVVAPWSKHSKMTYVDYRDVADVVALAFVDPRLSRGTFELAAGGMVDRIEVAEMMSRVAGRPLAAEDTDDVPTEPQGLATMFADYDRHGFHGGNSLVLQAILHREPRSVADFIAELAR